MQRPAPPKPAKPDSPREPSEHSAEHKAEHAHATIDAWLKRLDERISKDRTTQARRVASAAGSAPIDAPPPHPATLAPEHLLQHCTAQRERTRGPGGQHRNKVETGVCLTHEPTGVEASAGERRSVRENMPVAISRLRLALAVHVRTPVPAGDQRSALWRTRVPETGRLARRIVVSPAHADFPAILAEALDVLWASDLDPRSASARLACSSSQLVRLLKDHPPAMVWVNRHRLARGQHALK